MTKAQALTVGAQGLVKKARRSSWRIWAVRSIHFCLNNQRKISSPQYIKKRLRWLVSQAGVKPGLATNLAMERKPPSLARYNHPDLPLSGIQAISIPCRGTRRGLLTRTGKCPCVEPFGSGFLRVLFAQILVHRVRVPIKPSRAVGSFESPSGSYIQATGRT